MSRVFGTFIALAAMLAGSAVASAGILSSLPAGEVALIEDNDLEIAVGDKVLGMGDILLAVAEFPTFRVAATNAFVDQFDPTTPMITAVSLIKLAADPVITGGVIATFSLVPATAAEWLAATGIVVSGDSTSMVVYEDGPSSPSNHMVNGPSVAAAVAAVSDGTLLYEFGVTGAAGEFFFAQTTDLGGSPDDITMIDTLSYLAALNVVASYPGSVPLKPHNFLGTSGVLPADLAALFTSPTDLQLQGSQDTQAKGVFDVATDTNAYVFRVVPEPASLLVWAGLVGGSAVFARRRRKLSA